MIVITEKKQKQKTTPKASDLLIFLGHGWENEPLYLLSSTSQRNLIPAPCVFSFS